MLKWIWIEISLFQFTKNQREFHLVSIETEKCYYNPNLVWSNKNHKYVSTWVVRIAVWSGIFENLSPVRPWLKKNKSLDEKQESIERARVPVSEYRFSKVINRIAMLKGPRLSFSKSIVSMPQKIMHVSVSLLIHQILFWIIILFVRQSFL